MAASNVAIVTGAGSGVGRALAIRLARAGYAVTLVGRTELKLVETETLVRQAVGDPAATAALPIDLADDAAPRRVVDETLSRFGRIDALCNVAGAAPLQPIDQITPALWRETVTINLSAPVLLTAAAWPTFKQQRSGFVGNVSSMSSIDPFPGFNIYAAAKVGLNMFTKCTADEGAAIGVKAVCVAPGAVETPMLRQHFDEQIIPPAKTLAPPAVADVIADCLLGRRDFQSGETIILPSP